MFISSKYPSLIYELMHWLGWVWAKLKFKMAFQALTSISTSCFIMYPKLDRALLNITTT
jgi:hypothetical protein